MASVLSLCSFRRPRWLSIQQRIFYGDLLQFWLCDTRPVLRFYHGLCGIQLRFFSWYWSFMGQAAIPCKNEVLLWAVHAHNSTKIQQQIWVERHNTSTMDQLPTRFTISPAIVTWMENLTEPPVLIYRSATMTKLCEFATTKAPAISEGNWVWWIFTLKAESCCRRRRRSHR